MSGDVFDAVASRYDAEFTEHRLGRLLRAQVQRALDGLFEPGSHVLDLGCGTGEDAVWLARRGIRVSAVDGSTAMLEQGRGKAERAGTSDRISWHRIDLAAPGLDFAAACDGAACDGAYSNFGALNCVLDLRSLAAALAGRVKPGGRVLWVIMGPLCPWELVGHLLRGRPGAAFRRLRRRPHARLADGATIPLRYPSPRRVRRDFEPWFRPVSSRGVGVLLPPTDFRRLVDRWPATFTRLAALDERIGTLFPATWLNDHHLTILERN